MEIAARDGQRVGELLDRHAAVERDLPRGRLRRQHPDRRETRGVDAAVEVHGAPVARAGAMAGDTAMTRASAGAAVARAAAVPADRHQGAPTARRPAEGRHADGDHRQDARAPLSAHHQPRR